MLAFLICRHIQAVMEGQPHKLLESVADRLVQELLAEYHKVQGVRLHIKKPHVAVSGVVESLGEFVMGNSLCCVQTHENAACTSWQS